MPALELFASAGPCALIVVALAYALPRFLADALPRLIIAIIALFKVSPDKLPAVLRALAELFRSRR